MPAPSRSPRVVYSASPAGLQAAQTPPRHPHDFHVPSSGMKESTGNGARSRGSKMPTFPSHPVHAPEDPLSSESSPRSLSLSSFVFPVIPESEWRNASLDTAARQGESSATFHPSAGCPDTPAGHVEKEVAEPFPGSGCHLQDSDSTPVTPPFEFLPQPDSSPTPLAESRASSAPPLESRRELDVASRQFHYQSVQANAPDVHPRIRSSSSSVSSVEDGRSVASALTRKSDKTTATVHDPPPDKGFRRTSSDPPSTANGASTVSLRDQGASGGRDSADAARRQEGVTSGDASGQEEGRGNDVPAVAAGSGASFLGRLWPWKSENGDEKRLGSRRRCSGAKGRSVGSQSDVPPRRRENGSRDGDGNVAGPVETFLGNVAPVAPLVNKVHEGEGTEETLPGGENLLTDGDESSSPSAAPWDKEPVAGDSGNSWTDRWLPAYFRKSQKRRRILFVLLLLLLLLAIGLPVLFCVVAPRIVAEQVRASKVRVLSTTIENPDSTGFLASIVFEFLSSTPVTAHVKELPLEISWQGQPVGRMTVPSFTMEPSTRNVAFSSDFRVTDLANWNAFLMTMLREGQSEWRIAGRAEIQALGLTFPNIPFDKTVMIDGPPLPVAASHSQQARGFHVAEMDLTGSDADRLRVRATVTFNNTSTSSINSLGEVQFLMFYKHTPIGLLRSRGPVLLNSGMNTYVFDAELHPTVLPIAREVALRLSGKTEIQSMEDGTVGTRDRSMSGELNGFYDTISANHEPTAEDIIRFRTALSEMMSASLSGAPVQVETLGIYTTQPLFSAAVRALAVQTPVENLFGESDGLQIRQRQSEQTQRNGTAIVREMRFDYFEVGAEVDDENRAKVAAKVTVRFVNPLGHNSPLEIQQVSLTASLRKGDVDGIPMGVINGLMRATGPPRPVDRPDVPLNREEGLPSSEATESVRTSLETWSEERADVAAVEREEKLVNYQESNRVQVDGGEIHAFLPRSGTSNRFQTVAKVVEDPGAPRALSAAHSKPVLVNTSLMDVSFEMTGTIDLADGGVPFSAFIREMVSHPSPFIALAFTESDVEIRALTAVGLLHLTKLPLDQTLRMSSMGDMRNVHIESFEVTGEVPGAWLISTVVIFPSKAPTSIYLGNLGLNLSFRGVPIGSVVARNVHIAQGENKLTFVGRLEPPPDALETLSEFFSVAIASPPRLESGALETGPNTTVGGVAKNVESARSRIAPMMVVTISAASARLLEGGHDAIEMNEKGGETESDASFANAERIPLKWIQAGLEGVSMQVPVPQLGTTADLVRAVNMTGLHLSLDREETARSLDEAVPMQGYIELYLNNPLGKHLTLKLSAVSLTVALAVDVPTEVRVVPTPSGLYRPVVPLEEERGWDGMGDEETVGSEKNASNSARLSPSTKRRKTRRVTVGHLFTDLRELRSEAVGHMFSDEVETEGSVVSTDSTPAVDASVLRLRLPVEVPLELVGDGSAFAEFVSAFFEQDKVEMVIMGQAECTVQTGFGDVKIRNVDIESVMPLHGLNGFKGSKLLSLQVLGFGPLQPFLFSDMETPERGETTPKGDRASPARRLAEETDTVPVENEEKGLLLAVSVQMQNPSAAALKMPSIELDILHLGTTVGRMRGKNISLVTGDNFLNFVGGIILNRQTENAVSSLVSRALLNRDLELTAAVSDSRNGNDSQLPRWLVKAIRGAKILPDIPPLTELLPAMDIRTLLQDFSFDALTISAVSPPMPNVTTPSLLFKAVTSVLATHPLTPSVPLLVTSVSFSAAVLDLRGHVIGHLSLPATPAKSTKRGASPDASLLEILVNVEHGTLFLEGGGIELGRTIEAYLHDPNASLGFLLDGHASITVMVGDSATLVIDGLRIEKEVTLGNRSEKEESNDVFVLPSEHENMSHRFAPRLDTFFFDGVHPEGGAWISAVASMQNPAPVRLLLPRLLFDVSFQDVLLGRVWFANDVETVEASPLRTQLQIRGQLYRQTTARGLKALNELVKVVIGQVTFGDGSDIADQDEDTAVLVPRREEKESIPSTASVKVQINTGGGYGSMTTSREWNGGSETTDRTVSSVGSDPSSSSPRDQLPTWLAVGLRGLEVDAPVDGRQLFPVDMLKRLLMKEILVRVQPGLNAPLLLESFLRLDLDNPFGSEAILEIEDLSIRAELRDAKRNRVFGRLISRSETDAQKESNHDDVHWNDTHASFANALRTQDSRRYACVSDTQKVASLQDKVDNRSPNADMEFVSEADRVCVLEMPFSGTLAITDAAAFADFAVSEETPERGVSAVHASSSSSAVIRIEGDADVSVYTPLGRLVLGDMALRQNLPFSGMHSILHTLLAGGVRMQTFEVKRVVLDGEDGRDRILFSARVLLGGQPHSHHPAGGDASDAPVAFEVHAGALKLDLVSHGVVIGTIETRDAVMSNVNSAGMQGKEMAIDGELFEASNVRGTPNARLLSLMQTALNDEAPIDLLIRSHRDEERETQPAWLLDTIDRMQLRPGLSHLDSVFRLVEEMQVRSLSIAILDSTHLAVDAVISVDTHSPLGPDVELRLEDVAAEIRLFSPLSSQETVESVKEALREQRGELISEEDNSSMLARLPIATLQIAPRLPLRQVQEGDLLRVELPLSHVEFGDTLELVGDGELFGEFIAGLVNGDVSAMSYEAIVHATVTSTFGTFKVSGLKVRSTADFFKFAGRRDPDSNDQAEAKSVGASDEDVAGRQPRGLLRDASFDVLDLKLGGKEKSSSVDSGVPFESTMRLRLPLDVSLSLGSLAFRVEVPRTVNFEKPQFPDTLIPSQFAYLGTLRIPNLTIRPGASVIAVSGHVDPKPSDLDVVSDFLSRAVRGLSPYVFVLGEGVELSGAETPLWLSKTAHAMRLWIPMPATGLDAFVANSFSNVALKNVGISAVSPAVQGRDDAVALSADVRAKIVSPFGEGSRLMVRALDLDIQLGRKQEAEERRRREMGNVNPNGDSDRSATQRTASRRSLEETSGVVVNKKFETSTDNNTSGPMRDLQDVSNERDPAFHATSGITSEGSMKDDTPISSPDEVEPVGRLRLRDMPFEQVGDELHIQLKDVELEFDDRGDSFAALALMMMESSSTFAVHVTGTASVTVDTALGILTLRHIPLTLSVPVEGLEIFGGRTLEHLSEGALENLKVTDFDDKTVNGFHLSTRLIIENNHDVSVNLGPLAFDLTYEKTVIGAVVIPHFAMLPGRNEVGLEGIVKPEGLDAFSKLASAFFLESQYTIGVRGTPTKRLFSPSGGDASTAARLAISRAGIKGRAPRWLREVLANVDFSVPISSMRAGNPSQEEGGRHAEDVVTEMVERVELINIDVDFSGPRDPFISGEVQVFYALPAKFNIRHQIETVWTNMTIFHDHDQGVPTPIGDMSLLDLLPLPPARVAWEGGNDGERESAALVSESVEGGVLDQWKETDGEKRLESPFELRFLLDTLRLSIFEGAEKDMANMIAHMVNESGDLHVLLKGNARLQIRTAVGSLQIEDVPINLRKSFKCIGGLDPETVRNAFQMEDFGIQTGKAHGLLASANLKMMMPKVVDNFSVRLGKVTLDMFTPISETKQEQLGDFRTLSPPALKLVQPHPQFGYVIQAGMVQVADLAVPSTRPSQLGKRNSQENETERERETNEMDGWVVGKAVLLRPVLDMGGEEISIGTREIMSNYMNGKTSKLVIRGSTDSSSNPILSRLFAQMEVVVDLPGTTQKLIKGVQISFRLNFFVPVIEAVSIYENPVRVPIKLFYADMETFYEGQSLGGMVIDKNEKPDIIPPMQVSHSTPVRIIPKLQNTSAALAIVRNIVSGNRRNVAIDVKGEVRIGIQDFRIGLDVDMEGIQVAF